MPTERFWRLAEDKKKLIREAAVRELCRVPLNSLSINKIIQDADISRGSFYTYFEDKSDLIRYLLLEFADELEQFAVKIMEEKKGDVFAVAEEILELAMKNYQKDDGSRQFFENVIASAGEMEIVNEKMRQEAECVYGHEKSWISTWIRAEQGHEEERLAALHMLEAIVFQGLVMYRLNVKSAEEILKNFKLKVNIVRKGLGFVCRDVDTSNTEREETHRKQ